MQKGCKNSKYNYSAMMYSSFHVLEPRDWMIDSDADLIPAISIRIFVDIYNGKNS